MQGIFVQTEAGIRRPKSKKEIKDLLAIDPNNVGIEATSSFGNEFGGSAKDLPVGAKVSFVGPDPYTDRRFYGTLKNNNGKLVVS